MWRRFDPRTSLSQASGGFWSFLIAPEVVVISTRRLTYVAFVAFGAG